MAEYTSWAEWCNFTPIPYALVALAFRGSKRATAESHFFLKTRFNMVLRNIRSMNSTHSVCNEGDVRPHFGKMKQAGKYILGTLEVPKGTLASIWRVALKKIPRFFLKVH